MVYSRYVVQTVLMQCVCLPYLPVISLDLISSDRIFTFDFPYVFHSTFDLPTISEAIQVQ